MNIFVGNLPADYDDSALKDLCREFGTVVSAKVVSDRYSGRSRGFGFVRMSSDDEARRVISKLHQKEVSGYILVVNEARPHVTPQDSA